MIELKDISFRYSNGTTALNQVTMAFPTEHILALMGESGSGKTTLLKCIGRFLKPDSGQILLDGADIQTMKEKMLRLTVGIVFQKLYLFPHLSVLENLMLAPLKVMKMKHSEALDRSLEILERLGIQMLKDSYPSQISGGQAQRVAIARSLMLKPKYLLFDEPTSSLDIATIDSFSRWLLELRTDTTFILVTHDISFARKTASSGILLSGGTLKAKGKIEEIIELAAASR